MKSITFFVILVVTFLIDKGPKATYPLSFELVTDQYHSYKKCNLIISNNANDNAVVYCSNFFNSYSSYQILIPVYEDSLYEHYNLIRTLDDFFVTGLQDSFRPIFIRPQCDTVITFFIRQRKPNLKLEITYLDNLTEEEVNKIQNTHFWQFDFEEKIEIISPN